MKKEWRVLTFMDPDTVSIWISLISIILASVVVFCQKTICGVPDAFLKQIFEKEEENKLLRILLKSPRRFKSSMRCAYTFLHLTFAVFALSSIRNLPIFKNQSIVIKDLELFVCIIVFSLIIMVVSRGVPKRLAKTSGVKNVNFVAKIAFAIYIVFYPLRAVCDFLIKLISKIFGAEYKENEDYVTEEEIRFLMDVSENMGGIEQQEKEMINNIFELDDRTVDYIMTHRTDTVFIEKDSSLNEILDIASKYGYSRFPVMGENADDIIGIFNVKDLLQLIKNKEKCNNFKVTKYMRKPIFVPENTRCRDMFSQLNLAKTQIAIVIDEYGGTSGIVTMEDIVESIVGNIQDEYDSEDMDITEITKNRYIFNGDIGLNEVEKIFNCDLGKYEEDYETLGGLIIGQLERIPAKNENVSIKIQDINFKVKSSNAKQILTVIAYREEKDEEQKENV